MGSINSDVLWGLYSNWNKNQAWIFLLEGMVTVLSGCLSFWLIEDFPDTAKFITEAERQYIKQKMEADGQFSARGESFRIQYVWDSFRDYKTWIGSEYSRNNCWWDLKFWFLSGDGRWVVSVFVYIISRINNTIGALGLYMHSRCLPQAL